MSGTAIKDVKRGDTLGLLLQVSPVKDISGWTVFLTVNPSTNPSDDTAAIISQTFVVTAGQTFTDQNGNTYSATAGQFLFTVPNATTQSLVPGGYFYDMQVKDLGGNINSVDQGTFTVVADITRRIS